MSSKQVPASKQIIFPYELFQNAIPWWKREGWIHKAACMEGTLLFNNALPETGERRRMPWVFPPPCPPVSC